MNHIAIIFWSGTGNTEAMAAAIAKGASDAGTAVELFSVESVTPESALAHDMLILGCPAMGSEVLEEEVFEPFFTALEGSLQGKKLALFGSYGWGDGEWMRSWQNRCAAAGAALMGSGLTAENAPDPDALAQCEALGREAASF